VHEAELRRVSVYADSIQVDLALPAAVPVGSLLPPIVDILATEYGYRGESVPAWQQLSLPGDTALDVSKTLAQLGIRDGAALVLSRSSTELTAPRFDDVAEAVSTTLAKTAQPWTRRAARLTGAITASWLAGTGALVLTRTAFYTTDARRISGAGVAAAIGCIALLASAVAYRGFRDVVAGLTLGLLAGGFVALAGLLAVPGGPGAPNALLAAMAAAATSAAAIRVTGCGTVVFTALSLCMVVAAAAALVAAVTAVPLQAIAAASAAISLVLVELSARVSILLAGLSPRLADEPHTPHHLSAKAIRANAWLTSLVAAFSTSAALGAIGTVVAVYSADGPNLLGVAFATVTGGVLLLRARAFSDLAKSVPLVVSGTATLSVTFVVAATACPLPTPWLAAVAATVATAALCLGFITPAFTFSPVGRRSVDLLEYLALAAIVPLVCWICGLYSAARGLNLP
jgi:type VII secretion integral membrane protein EccD